MSEVETVNLDGECVCCGLLSPVHKASCPLAKMVLGSKAEKSNKQFAGVRVPRKIHWPSAAETAQALKSLSDYANGTEPTVNEDPNDYEPPEHRASSSEKPATMAERYPKYYKDVRKLDSVDVYRVHRLFGVTDNELHHASKKILLCGVRTGGKPARKEIEEARDTLNRWLEIQGEDEQE